MPKITNRLLLSYYLLVLLNDTSTVLQHKKLLTNLFQRKKPKNLYILRNRCYESTDIKIHTRHSLQTKPSLIITLPKEVQWKAMVAQNTVNIHVSMI